MEQETKNHKKILLPILGIIVVLLLLVLTGIVSYNLGLQAQDNKTEEKENINETKEEVKNEQNNNKETEEDTHPQLVGTKYEEFDKIIKNAFTKKDYKQHEKIPSFLLNRVHATEAGGFGDAYLDMYYFDEDETYLMDISDYDIEKESVVYAGTWEIKDNKLILTEKYILTQVNGIKGELPVPGGSFKQANKEYDFEVKTSNKKYEYTITNIGISQYKQDIYGNEENNKLISDNYKLNNKDWYSQEYSDSKEMLNNAYIYFNLINK